MYNYIQQTKNQQTNNNNINSKIRQNINILGIQKHHYIKIIETTNIYYKWMFFTFTFESAENPKIYNICGDNIFLFSR